MLSFSSPALQEVLAWYSTSLQWSIPYLTESCNVVFLSSLKCCVLGKKCKEFGGNLDQSANFVLFPLLKQQNQAQRVEIYDLRCCWSPWEQNSSGVRALCCLVRCIGAAAGGGVPHCDTPEGIRKVEGTAPSSLRKKQASLSPYWSETHLVSSESVQCMCWAYLLQAAAWGKAFCML